MCKIGTRVL